ncbi:MAG: glycosyltransferase family 39 protein [Candidatus Levybacteria bacterium]|nr:glycosyltransferase family 39 protein [Candidatus Levybacteria bacterium]
MSKFISTKWVLILILILAAFLRFWNLGHVPPSASLDEASIGYNAYSVIKTGADEFGELPLISQRGYDDWRRSTYLFLVVPFVALLDLNVVAVRLPAVILSVLTVLATYNVVLLLFSKRSSFSQATALMSAFLLAISPWHIYISRLGHESNACLSFLVFGILFFLRGQKNKKDFFLSIVFFTLSMISYYSGQALIPLLAIGLFFIFRKNTLSIVASNIKIFIIFIILVIPFVWSVFSPQALIRFQGTSTFKPESHSEMFDEEVRLRNKAVESNDIFGTLFYNRRVFPIKVLIQGYVSHFNPQWLFANSSNEPFKAPNMGLLYIWQIPFILIGFIVLIFTKLSDSKSKKLVLLWFFLGALPASIATQAPHAMRSYNILPTWQIFTALGLVYILFKFKKINILTSLSFLFFVSISLVSFYKNYFIVFPKEQSGSFQYSLHSVVKFVLSNEKSYGKIVFSNKDNLYQSYMFYLFDSKYDPHLYQSQGGTKSGGFEEAHSFGKYQFRPIIWNKDKSLENTLLIGNGQDFPDETNTLESFKNLDGKGEIEIVEIK